MNVRSLTKEIAEIGEQFLFSAAENHDLARCLGAASNKTQKIATVTVVVASAADDDDAARF
jgi:hypothetical protein